MSNDGRTPERVFSILCAIGAVAWGGWVVHQVLQTDDSPPMGAMCLAVPAFALLLFAGHAWPKSKE